MEETGMEKLMSDFLVSCSFGFGFLNVYRRDLGFSILNQHTFHFATKILQDSIHSLPNSQFPSQYQLNCFFRLPF